MERKTCTLSVRSSHPESGREGRLYFRAGRLVGAATAGLTGREAALEIVTWEHVDIEIADGCPAVEPEIGSGLSFLLMEGMRLKDERERGGEPAPPGAGHGTDPELDLETLLADPPSVLRPAAEELARLLGEALRKGKGMKGAAALLLVHVAGGVVAAAGEARFPAMVEAAARFLRDGGGEDSPQELLVTGLDRYWLARPVGGGDHFLLLVLDRQLSNLPRAQLDLLEAERAVREMLG